MHFQYKDWISHVFDHPVEQTQWHFSLDAPRFTADDVTIATLVAETFERSGADLEKFSDAQVNQGIWYIGSNACSDFLMQVRDGDAPIELKLRAFRSVYYLYSDCFSKRCTESLGHSNEPNASDLNAACYMFWDIAPWGYLVDMEYEKELSAAMLETLEKILRIPNRACREGALHGLGEIAYRYENDVARIIDKFLSDENIDPVLSDYALKARVGYVQ